MSRHVAPHRMADAAAGRTGERDVARIKQHLDGCPRCSGLAERLARARGAMNEIAGTPAPELGWDRIGVRLYWENSSARHAALRRQDPSPWPRRIALGVTGGALLAMSAYAVMTLAGEETAAPAAAATLVAPAPVADQSPVPAAMRGVVTFASGTSSVDGEPVDVADLFDRPIGAGTRLASAPDGRLVVQFGHESGFALGPGSSVNLRRFDDAAVEIEVVDGSLDVEVSKRRPGQSFSVIAGRHKVSVRGTAFRVDHRNGELAVACAHGRVVVTDGASEVALDAGQQIHLLREVMLARAARRQIDPDRLAELASTLRGPLLPAWTEPRALFDTSSIIDVSASAGQEVRLDGIDVGQGAFVLRVMSGRHKLEVADEKGDFGAGAWIEAGPGERRSAAARRDGAVRVGAVDHGDASVASADSSYQVPRDSADDTRAARRARRDQLATALDGSGPALQCMEPLEKRDLVAGSFIVFDVGINADGSQGHLNIAESNVPAEVERCLRRVVDAMELPPGPPATVRYKLAF
ncbi:MAG TPA: FecR family protein [Kofleriaceae bacterium]